MTTVITRIALRYVAAFLVAKGLLTDEFGTMLAADGDVVEVVQLAIGALAGVAAEVWYYAEQRWVSK
jgi:hypothetical protein